MGKVISEPNPRSSTLMYLYTKPSWYILARGLVQRGHIFPIVTYVRYCKRFMSDSCVFICHYKLKYRPTSCYHSKMKTILSKGLYHREVTWSLLECLVLSTRRRTDIELHSIGIRVSSGCKQYSIGCETYNFVLYSFAHCGPSCNLRE